MYTTIEIKNEWWDALTERLISTNFKYGRWVVHPVISVIVDNLQSVCEVYRYFPSTCQELLNQVGGPFTKEEYEQKVLDPIEALIAHEVALTSEEIRGYQEIERSLRNIRNFMGDDPQFLAKTFHQQISLLPGENKLNEFSKICSQLCIQAINETTAAIRASDSPNVGVSNS